MKLPCINCITLPICRSEYMAIREQEEQIYLEPKTLARGHLQSKCQLLKSYTIPRYSKMSILDLRNIELDRYMTSPLNPE